MVNSYSLIFVLALAGCTSFEHKVAEIQSPLRATMEELEYSPFNPPRVADGLGTIISFNPKGEETIEAARSSCLPEAQVPSLPPNPDFS
jgi:hypothetical protein